MLVNAGFVCLIREITTKSIFGILMITINCLIILYVSDIQTFKDAYFSLNIT